LNNNPTVVEKLIENGADIGVKMVQSNLSPLEICNTPQVLKAIAKCLWWHSIPEAKIGEAYNKRKLTKKANDGERFTAYRIDVQDGTDSWTLEKRYSEFSKLHKQLAEFTKELPPFPPKVLIGKFEEKTVEERRQKLDTYVQGLLKNDKTVQSPDVRCFFIPVERRILAAKKTATG